VNRSTISAQEYTPPSAAYHAATGTFFLGILVTWLLDTLIHYLYGLVGKQHGSGLPHGLVDPNQEVAPSTHPLNDEAETTTQAGRSVGNVLEGTVPRPLTPTSQLLSSLPSALSVRPPAPLRPAARGY
jgi:hypothetical protein